MGKIQFLDKCGTFSLEKAENYSYLYLPIAGETGVKSALTPNFGGDSKVAQTSFVMEPVSAENLHNNRSTRNFWVKVEGKGCWSATGASAEAENNRFTEDQDKSELIGGFMWQTTNRSSKKYGLSAKVTSFVPAGFGEEVMNVTIKNTTDSAMEITPVAAFPIYGRSAENIRDHRHVTSLLHRTVTTEYGVEVKPTMSFDERGHLVNDVMYFVYGVTGKGEKPVCFYPEVEEFIGDGGTFTRPLAVYGEVECLKAGAKVDGQETVGAIEFAKVTLEAGESATYTIICGATKEVQKDADVVANFDSQEKVALALSNTEKFWQEMVNVDYATGDTSFDNYLKWISFQPILRRIYGCSFLPYHDYGRGGRGWRDLWQDCLALLIMNPSGVRQMILNNFAGVRFDGSNATIIGSEPGEFVADRNSITRVWMDHGYWPFLTTEFYMNQTGDIEILGEKVAYFKDRQVMRGKAGDELWEASQGTLQMTAANEAYKGTVLEHLLLQQLCAFYEVGKHNHIALRGADWNDALDMAEKNGESVAFTCAYAGSMKNLAKAVRKYSEKTGLTKVEISKEIVALLVDDAKIYEDIQAKNAILSAFGESVKHVISGETVAVDVEEIATNLENKGEWIMEHVRATEWVKDTKGNGWFNGYYDNSGNQVEGIKGDQVRMMLTGQVFSIMSGTAKEEQVAAICKSADEYLYREEVGGYRLNTDFEEVKMDLGRAFGFAYGEKENGAVFSHMTVMYANALYQRGFAKEGHKALQTLINASMNFDKSKIYPGIPEYFNAKGRGMYHYLTGAASWYMLTMITEVFGVKGALGDLCIAPKLMAEQFDAEGNASLRLPFADRCFEVRLHNSKKVSCDEYKVVAATMNGKAVEVVDGVALIARADIANTDANEVQVVEVELA